MGLLVLVITIWRFTIMDIKSMNSCVFCSCDTGLIALMGTTIKQITIIVTQLGYGRIEVEYHEQISE